MMQRIRHYLSNIGEAMPPIEIERGWRILSVSTKLVKQPMSKVEKQVFDFVMEAKRGEPLTDKAILDVFRVVSAELKEEKKYEPIERLLTTVVMENLS